MSGSLVRSVATLSFSSPSTVCSNLSDCLVPFERFATCLSDSLVLLERFATCLSDAPALFEQFATCLSDSLVSSPLRRAVCYLLVRFSSPFRTVFYLLVRFSSPFRAACYLLVRFSSPFRAVCYTCLSGSLVPVEQFATCWLALQFLFLRFATCLSD